MQDFSISEAFNNFLNEEEISKATRFHHLKDQQSFVLRRAALRILLSQYLSVRATEIKFLSGKNKKPLIKLEGATDNIHFNTSHSGGLILITIANTEVGIDIEKVNSDFPFDEILSNNFGLSEIQSIKQSPNPSMQFFRLWTRKEALTKATSRGLDDDLNEIPSLNGLHQMSSSLLGSVKSWNISTFIPEKHYVGSIAHHPDRQTRFFDFDYGFIQ